MRSENHFTKHTLHVSRNFCASTSARGLLAHCLCDLRNNPNARAPISSASSTALYTPPIIQSPYTVQISHFIKYQFYAVQVSYLNTNVRQCIIANTFTDTFDIPNISNVVTYLLWTHGPLHTFSLHCLPTCT